MREIRLGDRLVGDGHPCYVVAELSANHNQHLQTAVDLIHAARDAGADAIKLQTYTADTLTLDSDKPWFQVPEGTLWTGRTLYSLYSEAYTPWEWHARLFDEAGAAGLQCFSTPFDDTAVAFLERFDPPAHKVASFELTDLPLLETVAATHRPVILSTGMATVDEIAEAVATLRAGGCTEIALLKCTSAYPARPQEMNLRTIPDLAERFDVVAGLSDHTLTSDAAVAAVALGAAIIEKHMTLSRAAGGPDGAFSLQPDEFGDMVQRIRTVEQALGRVSYDRTASEETSARFRRSIFVSDDVSQGQVFTPANVRIVRPAHGLAPRHYGEVLGRAAARDIERGTPLSWDLIA